MESLITLIKIMAICSAAGILGSWFSSEAKKNKLKGGPAYKVYLSLPGILIGIIVLFLPIFVWMLKQ
ncbi:MAG: hypothetical protein COX19_05545 [Desulfobacterales bacterium CG23_combo_of_CG06-09_8_20_14_all_51_8]|nr:MAG: hypothetical protein COX19_05545 [Desulfobacterales bacterium CG23_combo_of_CG06-09_8_20_14_all_51_8]